MARSSMIFAVIVAVPLMAVGAAQDEQLAIESYRHLVSHESLLDGAIRSGDRNDFYRFVEKPTLDMMQKWPQGLAMKSRFGRCYFAVDGFRVYAEDQFAKAGKQPKSAPSSKDYFEQKALCKKALGGKV